VTDDDYKNPVILNDKLREMFNSLAACLIVFAGWILVLSVNELLYYLTRMAS
jgi:hypothetical protein